MESHGIIVKTGAILDASVIDNPLKPKGKTDHKVTQDREDLQEVKLTKEYATSVYKEASWLKNKINIAMVTKNITLPTTKV